MKKERIAIEDVLGDTEKPITTFEEAEKASTGEKEKDRGGRPIKGRGKAIKKVAFHVDQETWEELENMINFPKEKSVNAVCKRLIEVMISLKNVDK